MNKPLIIGIDIRDLQLAKTGTKTYLEELCSEFRLLENEDYHFHFLDTRIPQYKTGSKTGKYAEHLAYQLWKQLLLPIKAWSKRCDILFCTDNFVPLLHLGYQTVPVFHDAFFFENPEHYGKLWLKLYHLTAIPAAKRAAFIVTPSWYAQRQIHKYTGIPPENLKVVYEGPKTMNFSATSEHILSKFNLKNKGYILHVGSMFKRKNIPALILAFSELKINTGSMVKLVLAGPSTASSDNNDFHLIQELVINLQLQEEVIFTGYLSDDELAGIYDAALFYVFPSLNEGFGIPVLEAFKYHLPVLVANNSCLPEIGGDAVISFDPYDHHDIYAKMKMALEDESLRKEMIRKGQIRLKDFSWKNTALQLLELFKTAHHNIQ